jgi:phosphoribosylformylglycinamidine synthase
MMFAQANSEHCRHKIFNARWIIDGRPRDESLFDMIRYTHAASPAGVLSAYRDNAAVIAGNRRQRHLWRCRRADRHSDEGRNAQSPDRDLAFPGRGHGLRRGDSR